MTILSRQFQREGREDREEGQEECTSEITENTEKKGTDWFKASPIRDLKSEFRLLSVLSVVNLPFFASFATFAFNPPF